jgi:hypothetical protein
VFRPPHARGQELWRVEIYFFEGVMSPGVIAWLWASTIALLKLRGREIELGSGQARAGTKRKDG